MKKSVKIALIIGTCFLLVGFVLWGVSARTDEFKRLAAAAGLAHAPGIGAQSPDAQGNNIASNKEALAALLGGEVSEFAYQAQGDVSSIGIICKTRNVHIIPSDVEKIEIKSVENEESWFKVSLEGGTLKLQEELKKSLINISDFFSFDYSGSENTDRAVYIYVPKDTKLESLLADCSFGAIKISGLSADEITVTSENGDIDINRVEAKSADIETSFGDIEIEQLSVAGRLNVTSKNGRIDITRSTSADADVISSFGNISLKELSTGELKIEGDNGDIDVESVTCSNMTASSSFGKIEISDTSASNITADSGSGGTELEKVFASAVKLTSSFGEIEVEDSSLLSSLYAHSDNGAVKIHGGSIYSIDARTSFGGVNISETEFISCYAHSSNGKVVLEKLPLSADETSVKAKTSSGSVSINGEKQAGSYERTLAGAKAEIDAGTSFGDIVIGFK